MRTLEETRRPRGGWAVRCAAGALSVALAACSGGGAGGAPPLALGTRVAPDTGADGAILATAPFDVAGMQFHVDGAYVASDDGRIGAAALRQGMQASVESYGDAAWAITVHADIVGPVAAVAHGGDGSTTFTILGQTVTCGAFTAWDADTLPGGPGAVTVGTALRIYGERDPRTNAERASRVERDASGGVPRVEGIVTAVDLAHGTVDVNTVTVDIHAASGATYALLPGATVQLLFPPMTPASPLVASGLDVVAFGRLGWQSEHLEGFVTAVDARGRFVVAHRLVDASGLGQAAPPAVGDRVRVVAAETDSEDPTVFAQSVAILERAP